MRRTLPKTTSIGQGATDSVGVDYFQLPYEYTYGLASYRVVYEAEWFVPGSSESVYSMKLLPERTGASACYNTKLACIAEDYGRVTVF